MPYFGSHFVFAYILNCSTLSKIQFSVWSSEMLKETESIKKKLNTWKQGEAPNLSLAAGLNRRRDGIKFSELDRLCFCCYLVYCMKPYRDAILWRNISFDAISWRWCYIYGATCACVTSRIWVIDYIASWYCVGINN